jgi:hypothetical protein
VKKAANEHSCYYLMSKKKQWMLLTDKNKLSKKRSKGRPKKKTRKIKISISTDKTYHGWSSLIHD